MHYYILIVFMLASGKQIDVQVADYRTREACEEAGYLIATKIGNQAQPAGSRCVEVSRG